MNALIRIAALSLILTLQGCGVMTLVDATAGVIGTGIKAATSVAGAAIDVVTPGN